MTVSVPNAIREIIRSFNVFLGKHQNKDLHNSAHKTKRKIIYAISRQLRYS